MADKYFLGNDPGNEGNFNTAANWSASGVPISGDNLFFTESVAFALTQNMDQSGITGGFGTINVTKGCRFKLGTSGSRFIFDATTVNFEGLDTAFITTDCTDFNVTGTAAVANALSVLHRSAGITNLRIQRGNVNVGAATITNFFCASASGSGTVVVVDAGGAITTGYISGGAADLNIAPTTLYMFGGNCKQIAGAPTTLWSSGGLYEWRGNADITTAHLFANGRVDASLGGVRTLTTLNLNPGSEFIRPLSGLTITNKNELGGVLTSAYSV